MLLLTLTYCEDTETPMLVPVSGSSQELICQEARNHFPDSSLFPKRSTSLTICCPLPQHTQSRTLLTQTSEAFISRAMNYQKMSFIHKKGLKAKLFHQFSTLGAFPTPGFGFGEDKGSELHTAYEVWLMWKKKIQNVSNQARSKFMEMLKSSL